LLFSIIYLKTDCSLLSLATLSLLLAIRYFQVKKILKAQLNFLSLLQFSSVFPIC